MPINVSAFNGCSKIVNFQIPNTLSSIPNGMLDQCDNINSIIIPPGVVLDTSSDIGNDNTIYNVTIDISANDSTLSKLIHWVYYTTHTHACAWMSCARQFPLAGA